MRTLHLGPEELLVAAKIAVQHDDTAAEVARAINAAEARIREAVPIARVIYLEPDIYSEDGTAAGGDPGPPTGDRSPGRSRAPVPAPTHRRSPGATRPRSRSLVPVADGGRLAVGAATGVTGVDS